MSIAERKIAPEAGARIDLESYFRRIAREEAEAAARRVGEVQRGAVETPWMNERELALYMRLLDGDGNPQTASIRKWATRAEYPLPTGNAGERGRRFHREQVDQWMIEEAKRLRGERPEEDKESRAELRAIK